jgi:MFS family permease
VPTPDASTRGAAAFEDATYRKVTWRLLPCLMLCYLVAYLDRVNVGFARLQMLADLGFSEAVYGFGAGIFFVGYFFFEVPSNLILHRVGARLWIGRIMITWGLVSASFMFIHTPFMFYTMRFLLGLAEAGFYPGIILYLTYWYPSERRARVTSIFMAAIPVSGIIGGPMSGWIMHSLAGVHGWAGWQWLFLMEGLPAVLVGIGVMLYLDNGIRAARWLTEPEKILLERNIERDRVGLLEHPSLLAVLADGRVWLMCLIYFACATGQYGLTFWMPALIEEAGVRDVLVVGVLTALPYLAGLIAMILFAQSADRRRERRWHLAIPMLLGALGLTLSIMSGTHTVLAMCWLTVAAIGLIAAPPLFWNLPTAFLTGGAAAGGIAAINSIANLGGVVSPTLVGWLRDVTHSTQTGMLALSLVLLIGATGALLVPARLVNR